MIDIFKVLPDLLKRDFFSASLASILNDYLNEIHDAYNGLFLSANLDKYDDRVLDEIAKDKSIVWYDSSLPHEQKVNLIKSYRLVYRTLGTETAVLQLIKDYFGSAGDIENWYDYEGEHHRFKITINDFIYMRSFLDSFNRFLSSLNLVKSADTWLDGVSFVRNITVNRYIGILFNRRNNISVIIQGDGFNYIKANTYRGVVISKYKTICVNIINN